MMRLYWRVVGLHVHVRVFVNGANAGTLIVRERAEWDELRFRFAADEEVLPDDGAPQTRPEVHYVPGTGFLDFRGDAYKAMVRDAQVRSLRALQREIEQRLGELGEPDGPLAEGLRKALFADDPEDLWDGK